MHKFFAKTQFLGKKVIFLPECHSTNDSAAELQRDKPQIEGTTIIAHNQTKGKGQRGNTWESEPGKNATFSVILKPGIVPANHQFQLHIIVTLAIHAALFPILGKKLKIKWPNDIFYGDKKIGGILIENTIKGQQIDSSVIGIGINVNQLNLTYQHATSINEITGIETEVNELIEEILIALEKSYLELKRGEIKVLTSQYLRRLYLLNTESVFEADGRVFSGKIIGVNGVGLLQIKEHESIHEFAFKEVSYK